jgi:GntR family transcriptional regulator, rspAB operon transcriptional repressor
VLSKGDAMTDLTHRSFLVRSFVYQSLKQDILTGVLPCGEKLREVALAERLKVSRTPVREALEQLAEDGLVQIASHKSAQVRALELSEIKHIYEVREHLEGLAARLAATQGNKTDLAAMHLALSRLEQAAPEDYLAQVQADNAFHGAIVAASGNKVLTKTLKDLELSVARVKWLTRTHNQDATTKAAHWAIVHAIETKQPEAAEIVARAHIKAFADSLTRRVKA